MAQDTPVVMAEVAKLHGAGHDADTARLRAMTLSERSRLIESACEAAVVIYRSRLAAGLADAQPAPWPRST